MRLSVIIRVRDDVRIARCIESIDEAVELVVVMNTPSPEIRQIVKDHADVVREIGTNNLALAYNIGIEAATHERVLLMDSDCVFLPGTLRKLYTALEDAPMAKGRIVFDYDGFASHVVALSREYHVSDIKNAYAPALAFRKEIKEKVGDYYFDADLYWTEDHEFDQRVAAADIPIHFDDSALITHAPLTVAADWRSAFHYGAGYFEGIQKGVTQPTLMYGGRKGILRSVVCDLGRMALTPLFFGSVLRRKGLAVAAYMTAWMGVFLAGYYGQAVFDVLGQRRRPR